MNLQRQQRLAIKLKNPPGKGRCWSAVLLKKSGLSILKPCRLLLILSNWRLIASSGTVSSA